MKPVLLPWLAVLLAAVGCASGSIDVPARIAAWKQRIDLDLPSGSSEEKIRAWAATNNVELAYDSRDRAYVAVVEHIPTKGFSQPCGAWMVLVSVRLNTQRQSQANEVTGAGHCL